MGKHFLRKDKTCLNCFHVVEKRFCPNCGQENIEQRKSFHHLFTHFIEDLVHYDNSFYRSVNALLFRPGKLTREYLAGKRQAYVPPVKMYIFINFLTFFLLSLLPSSADFNTLNVSASNKSGMRVTNVENVQEDGLEIGSYRSVREMDSIQSRLPEEKRLKGIAYWFEHKLAGLHEKYTEEELYKRFTETFISSVPKVLFLYMPLFAFVMWLFHGKRRWYYFDHGIFTLHYFSFLLITFTMLMVLNALVNWLFATEFIVDYGLFLLCLWWFYYFFSSHRFFYGESRWVSRSKGIAIFVINLVLILFCLLGAMIYAAVSVQ